MNFISISLFDGLLTRVSLVNGNVCVDAECKEAEALGLTKTLTDAGMIHKDIVVNTSAGKVFASQFWVKSDDILPQITLHWSKK